jgi:hypothetical protein
MEIKVERESLDQFESFDERVLATWRECASGLERDMLFHDDRR